MPLLSEFVADGSFCGPGLLWFLYWRWGHASSWLFGLTRVNAASMSAGLGGWRDRPLTGLQRYSGVRCAGSIERIQRSVRMSSIGLVLVGHLGSMRGAGRSGGDVGGYVLRYVHFWFQ